jgi:hypothetical protein
MFKMYMYAFFPGIDVARQLDLKHVKYAWA